MRRPVWPVTVVSVLLGCSDGEPLRPAPPEEYLGLQVPTDGFQLRTQGALIKPGEDVQFCEVGEVPGEPGQLKYIKGFELANAANGHHLIVSRARPGTAAEAKLRAMQVGERVECLSAAIEWGEAQIEVLGGTQTSGGRLDYPPGFGVLLAGGERIVFDYHFINPTTGPIEARSALNVHLTDAASVTHIARISDFQNVLVDIPARSKKSFIAECAFTEDVVLGAVQRHTHQTGTDFSVWFKGGARDGEKIWTSNDWKHDLAFVFSEQVPIAAGDGLRFECGFENPSDRPIRFGVNATDEMCVLFGSYWTEDENPKPQNCNVTWADADGVGHPADEAGGFPPASPSDALLCQLGQSLIPTALGGENCGPCICNACASILLECAGDHDCAALLKCFAGGCQGLDSCLNACEGELSEHSPGAGLIERAAACMSHGCPSCSAF